MSKVVALIPARYGSSRFPGKPLADIAGKSLIQRTFENAHACPIIDEVYIATDDSRISEHAEEFGASALMTSPSCPTGTDRVFEALESLSLPDDAIILNIQGDVPLLENPVIEAVAGLLRDNPLELVATAACPIQTEEEADSPHIVKCVIDNSRYALYFSRCKIPFSAGGSCPRYHHLGIYAYRTEFIRHYAALPSTPLQRAEDLEQLKILEHGFRIKVAIVQSKCFGIDKPEDVEKVKRILWQ